MSYELADGSMSTDYKIGDKFTHKHRYSAIFSRNDGTGNPWFTTDRDNGEWAINWCFLTPVKPTALINQLRKTIKQLEATIQVLER
jgi:hypothetical protein